MYYRGEDTRQEEPPIASQSSPASDMASSGIPDLTTPKGVEIFLSTTTPQFSVSRVDVLKGGSANFTYRAHLLETFSEGEEAEEVKSVIVKHAELFLASAKEVRFDVRRCFFEQAALSSLASSLPKSFLHPVRQQTPSLTIPVKVPTIYCYSPEPYNTLVLADAGAASLDLKTALLSSSPPLNPDEIGVALGSFLSHLHRWGVTDERQAIELRNVLKGNTQARDISLWATYGRLLETIEEFEDILEGNPAVFAKVVHAMTEEIHGAYDDQDEGRGRGVTVLHGDFWPGNVLVSSDDDGDRASNLMIVDWELAKLAPAFFDVAQVSAELFLPFHFKGIRSSLKVLSALLREYRSRYFEDIASDATGVREEGKWLDFAGKSSVHFGVHLIIWPPRVSGWGDAESIRDIVRIGAEYVKKGWERDRIWLESSCLGELLGDRT